MNKNKIESVAVWLIMEDGVNANKILLQQRSEKDNKKIQSFPFVCQPTFNGKTEPRESIEEAMQREAREELGENFKLPNDLSLFDTTNYEFLPTGKAGKNIPAASYNFYAKIKEKDLQNINLHSGAVPELIFISKNDLLKIKTTEDKTANPKEEIIMFKDQLATLQKLFELKP